MSTPSIYDIQELARYVEENTSGSVSRMAYQLRQLTDELIESPAPQVIRTVEELEALDGDARLITRSGLCRSARWFDGFLGSEIGRVILLPAVVIATGEEMREARKELEEAELQKENDNA